MKKGITPIISIIILLGIAVAIAGTAYTFAFGLASGYTTKLIEILPGTFECRDSVARIHVRNGGTAPIQMSEDIGLTQQFTADGNTLGLWHFNEGNFVVSYDSSPYGNNVNLNSVPWTIGKFRSALHFDGTMTPEATVTASPEIDVTGNELTVEAWVKLDGVPLYSFGQGGTPIVAKTDFGLNNGYILAVYNDSYNAKVYFALIFGSRRVLSVTNLTYNEWHHVAGVKNNTNIMVYIDGQLDSIVADGSPVVSSISEDITIGRGSILGMLNGTVDEVRISNVSRPMGQLGNGWTYTCPGTGESRQCGDITITKTKGGGVFTPGFDKTLIPESHVLTFRDSFCTGKCEYTFATLSSSKKIALAC